jgi:hypothetical protein
MQNNPTLSREHIDWIRSVAQLRSVRSGEVLSEPSQPDIPLFIVLDGTELFRIYGFEPTYNWRYSLSGEA